MAGSSASFTIPPTITQSEPTIPAAVMSHLAVLAHSRWIAIHSSRGRFFIRSAIAFGSFHRKTPARPAPGLATRLSHAAVESIRVDTSRQRRGRLGIFPGIMKSPAPGRGSFDRRGLFDNSDVFARGDTRACQRRRGVPGIDGRARSGRRSARARRTGREGQGKHHRL